MYNQAIFKVKEIRPEDTTYIFHPLFLLLCAYVFSVYWAPTYFLPYPSLLVICSSSPIVHSPTSSSFRHGSNSASSVPHPNLHHPSTPPHMLNPLLRKTFPRHIKQPNLTLLPIYSSLPFLFLLIIPLHPDFLYPVFNFLI